MSAQKQQKPLRRSIGKKIWNFFNSLKLTLAILLTTAVVSIIGTVVQQDQAMQSYVAQYGEKWGTFIIKAGMNDMYHTVWFTFLLVLLVCNIVVCTFERFPPKWRVQFSGRPNFNSSFIGKLKNSAEFTVEGDLDSVKARVKAALKKKKFKIVDQSQDGAHAFYAWKGKSGLFGSDIIHISLLLILVGSIVGSMVGYKGFKVVTVGSEFQSHDATHKIRLDKFWLEYYDSGQIKQYNSILTVIEDGKDLFTKQIWVNEPLYYKGTRYYQSSWGTSWKKIKEAEVAIKLSGEDTAQSSVRVPWMEKRKLPGTDYEVRLVAYVADFAFDEATKTVYSKSMEEENPAIMLKVYRNDTVINTPWVFLNYPGLFKSIPGSDDELIFSGYRSMLFSGLSVNNDPGTNIVWVGAILMGVGFILAFFVFHKRVWVNIKGSGQESIIKIGAMANKNKLAIEKDLAELIKILKDSSQGS